MSIQFKGKKVLNQNFDTFADAVQARKEAEKQYFNPVLEKHGKKTIK